MDHPFPNERNSALWGKGGSRGDNAKAARWGTAGRRGMLALVVLVLGLVMPTAAFAGTLLPLDTVIKSGPLEGSTLTSFDVSLTYAANQSGVGYQCSLDGQPFSSCANSGVTYSSMSIAPHTFAVRAADKKGNVDTTPVTRSWRILPWISTKLYTPGTLLANAQASPYDSYKVIVETSNRSLQKALVNFANDGKSGGKLSHEFTSIPAISAKLPGWAILYLAENPAGFGPVTITPDRKVTVAGFSPVQNWQQAMGADHFWSHDAVTCPTDAVTGLPTDPTCLAIAPYAAPDAPTIAIVDSGIEPGRGDFGNRVLGSVAMSSLSPGASDDGAGHGTFVASIAAGASDSYPGTAPTAKLLSVRVMDENGQALTSDVIAAADWILANKDTYNIKVANFSLHASSPNSFKFDPLDHAVERLWFSGVTVVAASGNFGTSETTGVPMYYAPGNDPFVITVGAADTKDTAVVSDDDVAYWSAFGYTADGFAKPEIVAPGRYIIGATPANASMAQQRPDHVVAPGYMKISGTSFAAPAVAGIAANLLALHPNWSPDQIKGALMLGAIRLPTVGNPIADGRGEVNESRSATVLNPPNPNAALDRFIVTSDSTAGGNVFDAQSWSDAAKADMSWASMSWSDQSWSDESWSDQSWSDQSWSDQSWSDMSWSDQSWSDMSWSDMSWASMSWSDSSSADSSLADYSAADKSNAD
jgi:serine protease AprX